MASQALCAKLPADYGADIKIETPGRGDPARWIAPFLHDLPHPEGSGMFLHLNRMTKNR
jgi:crotonobetainyl-CoA:carnitine CoA-transferase CaiB-like acyl-CoA transferase